MPELPEVETIVRDLRPLLVGCTITAVQKDDEELRLPWNRQWESLLLSRRFRAVNRRGKWILCELTHKGILVFHMGMTGQLTVAEPDQPRRDHTHLIFSLRPGKPSTLSRGAKELRFRDIRRFGSATFFESPNDLETFFEESRLGPEPFSLDPDYWAQALTATSRCIKAVLLDQQVVAGLGNIYVDEILFHAKVHPSRLASKLTPEERERIRQSIGTILHDAIEHRGSTIRNYIGGSGLQGGYQDEFLAYGRAGLPCSRCKTNLKNCRISGRTTTFCPVCQPAPQKKS